MFFLSFSKGGGEGLDGHGFIIIIPKERKVLERNMTCSWTWALFLVKALGAMWILFLPVLPVVQVFGMSLWVGIDGGDCP